MTCTERPSIAGLSAGEAGFSLMEALVAATVAIIAVLGLAHSFGVGRGMINRYEVGRAALSAVQERMEILGTLPATDPQLAVGVHPASPLTMQGLQVGTLEWRVEPYDDPITPDPFDLKRVLVVARWTDGAQQDSLVLSQLFKQE